MFWRVKARRHIWHIKKQKYDNDKHHENFESGAFRVFRSCRLCLATTATTHWIISTIRKNLILGHGIATKNVMDAINVRHSIRAYQDRQVEEENHQGA